eukprot:1904054-Amphidinium_carterae.1
MMADANARVKAFHEDKFNNSTWSRDDIREISCSITQERLVILGRKRILTGENTARLYDEVRAAND